MTPGDLAEDVVEEDIGAARRVGAGVVADDGVEAERALDEVVLEPAVEEIARALDEQVHHVALRLDVEAGQPPPLRRGGEQRAQAAAGVRRGLQRQVAEDVGDALERRLVPREGLGVLGREAGELGLRARRAAAQFQVAAVVRQEVGDRPRQHPPAALVQAHVADDFRPQQADGVACRRVAEAGGEFLGHRRPADDVAAFEDADLQPRAGEIEGADEAVVAAADDQRVIGLGHIACTRRLHPGGGARSRRASGMAARILAAKLRRQTSLAPIGPAV